MELYRVSLGVESPVFPDPRAVFPCFLGIPFVGKGMSYIYTQNIGRDGV